MRMFTRSIFKSKRRDKLATATAGDFMCFRVLVLVLSIFSLPFRAGAADVPLVTLGGEVTKSTSLPNSFSR